MPLSNCFILDGNNPISTKGGSITERHRLFMVNLPLDS